MVYDRITYKGIIEFNPKDKTKKHESQSSWKKMAMIYLPDELSDYYAWFINRRYSLQLIKPLRGAHISFINDSLDDIKKGCNYSTKKANQLWDAVAKQFNGKEIDVTLFLDPRSDGQHWWLNIPEENRSEIHSIRKLVGLERPFFGLHMSIGHVNEKNKEHSDYILSLLTKHGNKFY